MLFIISLFACASSLAQDSPVSAEPLLPSVATNPSRLAEASTALGEFEGRYKVGSTTCTVKPIKMAFEVRWAKGTGTMVFFYDSTTPEGKAIFSTEDTGKGRDKFIFDDNHYNSGHFIRADGKQFTVKKIRLFRI